MAWCDIGKCDTLWSPKDDKFILGKGWVWVPYRCIADSQKLGGLKPQTSIISWFLCAGRPGRAYRVFRSGPHQAAFPSEFQVLFQAHMATSFSLYDCCPHFPPSCQ